MQEPAEGILIRNNWGDSKQYQVVCECHDPDHDHNIVVESDETEVSVVIYTTTTNLFWSVNRWKQIWELLTKGYIKQEVAICMQEQQAKNYANTLIKASEDVKLFRTKRRNHENL
jgi:hypothetical protein